MRSLYNRLHPLVRVPLLYGVLGGLLGFALVVILYYIGKHPFLISVIIDFRIALFGIFMFFLLKELRDYNYGGILYFWQGLISTGLFTILFAIVASSLIWSFGINVPGFVTKYVELATNQLRNLPPDALEQVGQEFLDRSLASLPSTTAFDLAALYFVQCFGIGLFISIILSVILRRQPKPQ